MANWIKFEHNNSQSFGIVDDNHITVYEGDMFNNPTETDSKINLSDVVLKNPCQPTKMIALWNNYQSLANEKGLSKPNNPLYLNKAISCIIDQGENIIRPKSYEESIFFEGELGIVIGQPVKDLSSLDDAKNSIFGYTCINDVTAFGLLKDDPNFDQWTRSKGFDGFGVYGPYIASGLDPKTLNIQTIIKSRSLQLYR